jgi:uncharacterized damage-inducible protein DinB
MYKSLDDFFKDWNYEAESTLKVFKNLTDESLSQKVTPNGRSLGFIAWHITTTIGEMMSKAGLKVDVLEENAQPTTASEIVSAYEKANAQFAHKLPHTWTDEMMDDTIQMYGEEWKKGATLHILLAHQVHHRGQMTVLMRQAGLKVPGFYGPVYEDWAQWKMEPAK